MSSSLSKQTGLLGVLGIIFKRRAHSHVSSVILNPKTHKTFVERLSFSLGEGQSSESFVKIMELKPGEDLCTSHMDVEENWKSSIPLRIFPKCKKWANGLYELRNFLFDDACCL